MDKEVKDKIDKILSDADVVHMTTYIYERFPDVGGDLIQLTDDNKVSLKELYEYLMK